MRALLVLGGFMLTGLAASASAAPFQCSVNTGVPPTIRADGLAEPAGNLTLVCTGGTPTPAGQAFPQFNFTVLLNTNATSKITGQSEFSEALLLVDEPASFTNPSRPMLNCGNNGAPDNGTSGPGVCSAIGTGNPIASYDGTANGFGSAACDGAGGRPAANTYGCGRPNVFQGRIGTPQSLGQLNAITFFNVPVDPPGDPTVTNTYRTLRIANVRVNAASIGIAPPGDFFLTSVQATIAATGSIPVTISNPSQAIAYVAVGLLPCTASGPSRIRVCETFGSDWKPKNLSFDTGNGIPGNTTVLQAASYPTYDGATHYPPDVAQNVPGAIYNTESGFEWQNSSPNGPPNPNPPYGFGTVDVTATHAPFNSGGFGGLNTGISGAGVANAGTRFALRFTGIPAGASVQVPTVVNSYNGGTSPSGVLVLTNTDASGAGAFSPADSGTLTGNLAVYEVLWADPFSIEYAEVPYTLINAPPGATVQVTAGFAPFYSDSGSQQPEASAYPVPRFLDSNYECGGQSCLNAAPSQGLNSGPVQVTLTNYGEQMLTGAQVLLRAAGSADILGTNLSSPASNALVATFNLAGAALGARDIVITPSSGPTITLAGGFSILQSPACAYSVWPQSIHAPATGVSGNLVVSVSAAQCSWTAITTSNWITMPAVSSNLPIVQPYAIIPNAASSQLTGTITIAGESIPVTQDAASTCTYAITPGSTSFGVSGGTLAVSVTAAPGCAWSTSSTLSWVSFPNGSSGSGNGSVTIQVAQNVVGLLSGTLTIAGQPFAVRQDAASCGGTNVSNQVSASLQALLEPWNFPLTQQLRLTNQGAAIPGPIWVVFYGVCGSYPGAGLYCPLSQSSTTVTCGGGGTNNAVATLVSIDGLAANQTIFNMLQFLFFPYLNNVYPYNGLSTPGAITYSVVSGAPGS